MYWNSNKQCVPWQIEPWRPTTRLHLWSQWMFRTISSGFSIYTTLVLWKSVISFHTSGYCQMAHIVRIFPGGAEEHLADSWLTDRQKQGRFRKHQTRGAFPLIRDVLICTKIFNGFNKHVWFWEPEQIIRKRNKKIQEITLHDLKTKTFYQKSDNFPFLTWSFGFVWAQILGDKRSSFICNFKRIRLSFWCDEYSDK